MRYFAQLAVMCTCFLVGGYALRKWENAKIPYSVPLIWLGMGFACLGLMLYGAK